MTRKLVFWVVAILGVIHVSIQPRNLLPILFPRCCTPIFANLPVWTTVCVRQPAHPTESTLSTPAQYRHAWNHGLPALATCACTACDSPLTYFCGFSCFSYNRNVRGQHPRRQPCRADPLATCWARGSGALGCHPQRVPCTFSLKRNPHHRGRLALKDLYQRLVTSPLASPRPRAKTPASARWPAQPQASAALFEEAGGRSLSAMTAQRMTTRIIRKAHRRSARSRPARGTSTGSPSTKPRPRNRKCRRARLCGMWASWGAKACWEKACSRANNEHDNACVHDVANQVLRPGKIFPFVSLSEEWYHIVEARVWVAWRVMIMPLESGVHLFQFCGLSWTCVYLCDLCLIHTWNESGTWCLSVFMYIRIDCTNVYICT